MFGMIRHTQQTNPQHTLVGLQRQRRGHGRRRRSSALAAAGLHRTRRRYGRATPTAHVLMKVETHNHPTAISPFPGASTGAGGEIRDEGATGRGSKPKAGLTGFSVSNLHLPGTERAVGAERRRQARAHRQRRCRS
jgi:phosphoribosylformylglycinamidine synthase